MPGALDAARDVTKEEADIALALKEKIIEKTGAVESFEAVKVKTQVVAGTNYFFKISLGGDKYAHVRIYKPLSGEPTVSAVKVDMKLDDEIEYFEP